jgi:type IV pilus assembly protein PilZ
MAENAILKYEIKDPVELNLSYMPFITNGGLFIPIAENYALGDIVFLDLSLPAMKDSLRIEGKVIWITPKNALHHVLSGIGIQFTGSNTTAVRAQIEAQLDNTMEVGGYTYGMIDETNKKM